jgi:putative membrane protein
MKFTFMGTVLAVAVAAAGAGAQQTQQVPQSSGTTQQSGGGAQQGGGTGQQGSGSMQQGAGSMQQGTGSMQQGSGSSADKMFVQHAMAGSTAEIKLGQLASEKASSQQVKQFGQMMVQDHTQLNDQMKPIAQQMGVSMTSNTLPPEHQQLQTKLEGLSGDAFDKAYMKAMVKDHQKDLSEFKKESKNGQSPEVKNVAQQGSQVIQKHLQMAQQVAQQVGAVGGNMTNSGGTSATSTPTGPQ